MTVIKHQIVTLLKCSTFLFLGSDEAARLVQLDVIKSQDSQREQFMRLQQQLDRSQSSPSRQLRPTRSLRRIGSNGFGSECNACCGVGSVAPGAAEGAGVLAALYGGYVGVRDLISYFKDPMNACPSVP